MKWPKQYCVPILVATLIAIALPLRLPKLEQRPMHTDEAVHAYKFGDLLEKGFYQYNPKKFHGPTLYYLTLIPAWFNSAQRYADINELTLRIVPVFFGVLLVLMPLLLSNGLGRLSMIVASILTAFSPAFVFYSRYYIHEMLLVCFTFGLIASGYRYTQGKKFRWALLTGIFLGLCHATKETCIIALGSMLLALVLTLLMHLDQSGSILKSVKETKCWHAVTGVAVAAIVSALFYSSFFNNTWGILDSLYAYTFYFKQAGQNELHIHPWYYYLKMLIYSRFATGPIWSEAFIVLLAGIGFVVAMTRKGIVACNVYLLRFIVFYTISMTVLYSAVPYKTPWCMLGFLHGMILLAAVGAVAVIKLCPMVLAYVFVGLLLIAGGAHLAWQSYQANYKYYADTANPYVYAHTSKDVFTIVERIEEVIQAYSNDRNMPIQVICPGYDYWPLPWYLRSFTHVRYQIEVADDVPIEPVIIASPNMEPALIRKLYELPPPGERNLYMPLFDTYVELRPGVELRGYVVKALWDRYQ